MKYLKKKNNNEHSREMSLNLDLLETELPKGTKSATLHKRFQEYRDDGRDN